MQTLYFLIILCFIFSVSQTFFFIIVDNFFCQKPVFRMPDFVQNSQGSDDLWDGDKLLHITGAVLEFPLDLDREDPRLSRGP